MDHPAAVSKLIIMDGVPILEALERCDAKFAKAWWHWFFFAQPHKPEQAINADPEAWYGGSPEQMGAEAFADFQSAIHDPQVVHGMIEDYRAGLSVDHLHDATDRAIARKIQCNLLVLWSQFDDLELLYGDVVGVWRRWTGGVV
jgi:haloacetate dehalogenase